MLRRCYPESIPAFIVVLLALSMAPVCSEAATATESVLVTTGHFLLDALKDYAIHEAITRSIDYVAKRKTLQEVEASLTTSLNDVGRNSDARTAELREELNAAKIQLDVLGKLEKSNLTRADLDPLRDQITYSLGRVSAMLDDHEQRLTKLEREMEELKSRSSAAPRSVPTRSNNVDAGTLLRPSFNCANARTRPELLIAMTPCSAMPTGGWERFIGNCAFS
jgi:hypothetical protein